MASADKTNLAAFKAETGVPMEYASCQTTIGGYFVDGHIPLEAIEWLLTERPDIDGIALPGMPPGSPGGGARCGPPRDQLTCGAAPRRSCLLAAHSRAVAWRARSG